MAKFGQRSLDNLAECHQDLQAVFNRVIVTIDCSVIEGVRNAAEQDKLYRAGLSKLRYPSSRHNQTPSTAADVVPYPIDWDDYRRFYLFAGFVLGTAVELGIKLRWGGDWNGDWHWRDQVFHDLPHFELARS